MFARRRHHTGLAESVGLRRDFGCMSHQMGAYATSSGVGRRVRTGFNHSSWQSSADDTFVFWCLALVCDAIPAARQVAQPHRLFFGVPTVVRARVPRARRSWLDAHLKKRGGDILAVVLSAPWYRAY